MGRLLPTLANQQVKASQGLRFQRIARNRVRGCLDTDLLFLRFLNFDLVDHAHACSHARAHPCTPPPPPPRLHAHTAHPSVVIFLSLHPQARRVLGITKWSVVDSPVAHARHCADEAQRPKLVPGLTCGPNGGCLFYAQTHARAHSRAQTHTHTHTHTHARVHVRTHALTHRQTHACTRHRRMCELAPTNTQCSKYFDFRDHNDK